MVAARSERKRIAILTGDGPEHRYVVNILCSRLSVDRVIIDKQSPKTNIRRALSGGFGHFAGKAARAGFLKLIGDREVRIRTLHEQFGKMGAAFDTPEKPDYVTGINSAQTIALLKQIDPDALLIYGTTVVKSEILDLARDICINMHTGISPYYRGTACTFWPIVNDDFDMLGATVHECTSRIDGGAIFEITRITCEPGDSLHTVFGRAVTAGASAYVKVVERYLAGTLQGTLQDLQLGREYRGSELTLRPELIARRRLAQLKAKHIQERQIS